MPEYLSLVPFVNVGNIVSLYFSTKSSNLVADPIVSKPLVKRSEKFSRYLADLALRHFNRREFFTLACPNELPVDNFLFPVLQNPEAAPLLRHRVNPPSRHFFYLLSAWHRGGACLTRYCSTGVKCVFGRGGSQASASFGVWLHLGAQRRREQAVSTNFPKRKSQIVTTIRISCLAVEVNEKTHKMGRFLTLSCWSRAAIRAGTGTS